MIPGTCTYEEMMIPHASFVRRAEIASKFIGTIERPVLDIGGKSWVGNYLQYHFQTPFDNTLESDFNWKVLAPKNEYETIVCLEVLEHLFNPASFLFGLKWYMGRETRLFVSCPVHPPMRWMTNVPTHFNEYKPEQIKKLFDYCGLEIKRELIFKTCNLKEYKEPGGYFLKTVRMLSLQTQIYELKRKPD